MFYKRNLIMPIKILNENFVLPSDISAIYIGGELYYQKSSGTQYGLSFNGTNSIVTLGTGNLSDIFNGSTDFTITAYCYTEMTGNAYVNTFREHLEVDIYVASGGYSFRMKDGSTHSIDATAGQSSGWCVLACTFNHTTNQMRFLINGTPIGTATITTPSYVKGMSDAFSQSYGAGYTFDGILANFAVYNTLLNDTQIGGLSGKDVISGANLLHHWDFQDGAGDTLTDIIGGVNGTISNCTWVTI
jgi:hypothetical protein